MKQEKQDRDQSNSIEQRAKELFGYDEDSLLAEMDEAERAWEAEKAADPELEAKTRRETDEGFEKLMDHIKAKGIQPVSPEEYEKEERRINRKVVGVSRKRKKVLLLAAAVCVLGIGMTMVVSARRQYRYNLYPVEAEQNVLIKQKALLKMDADELQDAYAEIEDTLGIRALRFGHVYTGMKFKQGIVDKKHIIIELEYGGMSIYLKEAINPEIDETVQVKASDRKVCEQVYNEWLRKNMVIEQNDLKSGQTEYSTYFNEDNAYYSLSGILEKAEFIELVKGLSF